MRQKAVCKGIPFTVEISALAGMELGMAILEASALTTATEAPWRKQLCDLGKERYPGVGTSSS